MTREPSVDEIMAEAGFEMAMDKGVEVDRLKTEIERLRALAKEAGDAIEKLAFDIPPPNEHTPRLVMMAQSLRRAALETREPDVG